MINFDAITTATVGTATLTWNHTPVGTPRGVLVFIMQNGSTIGTNVGTVTYGGSALTQVSSSPMIGNTTEGGVVYGWFLGSGIPAGVSSVSAVVAAGAGTSLRAAGAITMTADTDTFIANTGTIKNASLGTPTFTVSPSSRTVFAAIGIHSGVNAVTGLTPFANWNSRYEYDYTSQTAAIYTFNTIDGADVSAGWTQAADDAHGLAVLVAQTYEILTVTEGTVTTTGDPVNISLYIPQVDLTVDEGTVTTAGDAITIGALSVIDDTADDGHEYPQNTWNGSTCWFGHYTTSDEWSGLRFQVFVPQGATITTANLILTAGGNEGGSYTVNAKIKAQAIDNASAPSGTNLPSTMTLTDTGVDLDASYPAGWVTNTEYTYSITSVIGEVIARPDWVSGNYLNVIIVNDGTAGNYDLKIYDKSESTKVARLYIEYTTTTDTPTYITVAEGTIIGTEDAITLGVFYPLTVAEGVITTIGDAVTLNVSIPTVNLTVAEGTVTTIGDAVTLAYSYTLSLVVAEGSVTVIGDLVTLGYSYTTPLTVAEGVVTVIGDVVGLTYGASVTVAEGSVTTIGDAVTLTFKYTTPLTVAEGSVTVIGDPVMLSNITVTMVTVAEGIVTTIGDPVTLQVAYPLNITEGVITSIGDPVILRAIYPLGVTEGYVIIMGDPVTILLASLILPGTRRVYYPERNMVTTGRATGYTRSPSSYDTGTRNTDYIDIRKTAEVED